MPFFWIVTRNPDFPLQDIKVYFTCLIHSDGKASFEGGFTSIVGLTTPQKQMQSVKEFGFIESPQTAAEPQNRFNYKLPTLGKEQQKQEHKNWCPKNWFLDIAHITVRFYVTFTAESQCCRNTFWTFQFVWEPDDRVRGSSNSCGGIYGGSHSPHPIPGVSWGRSQ